MEGLFYPQNNSLEYHSPFFIMSDGKLYVMKRTGDIFNEVDTLNIKKDYFYNNKEKVKFEILKDTSLRIASNLEYFGSNNVVFNKLNLDIERSFSEDLLIKVKWYSTDISYVEEMNRDTIFYHFDEKKGKFNAKILQYYIGSNSKNDPAIDSWEYLKVGSFDIIKFNYYIPAYFIISTFDEDSISGFILYHGKKPKKATIYKD